MYSLVEMLTYKRPVGSLTQKEFCQRFLKPHFGMPDIHGNYTLIIGDRPKVCFTAHHDTVHKTDGMQKIIIEDDIAKISIAGDSNCLGADCTTGIWLMLNMIEAKVEGIYVVHNAEESGCKGSRAMLSDYPLWLSHIDAVISFDRYGKKSIITHQMGVRTASNNFAHSLANILDLPMDPDDSGSYTDSNEYANDISECTNLSVGYLNQHTKGETQDLEFADLLSERLVAADWSKLVIERDPNDFETLDYASYYRSAYNYDYSGYQGKDVANIEALEFMLQEYGMEIAEYLDSMGFYAESLCDELKLSDKQMSKLSQGYNRYKYM